MLKCQKVANRAQPRSQPTPRALSEIRDEGVETRRSYLGAVAKNRFTANELGQQEMLGFLIELLDMRRDARGLANRGVT
jgi:hypothetical protein